MHAFLHVDAEEAALAAAARSTTSIAAGTAPASPLAGVPLAIKDVVVTEGLPTTAGSKILEGWRPPYDATITARLRAAGIVMLGKTNMDEFAMGSSTENSAYGPTHNPWDLDRIPGGSGGGSAAAVAAFEAPLAIGTDTGGSIRQPAAVTGTVGVKPTYGGVSRYGLIAFSSSLDQAGPFARTVLDAALLHEVIAGHDPCDSTSIDAPVPAGRRGGRVRGPRGDLSGVRVGVVRELGGEGYQPGVLASFEQAVDAARELGAEVVEVCCPHFEYALAAYYLIAPSECRPTSPASTRCATACGSATTGRVARGGHVATREAGFGAEVKRRIMLGTYALSSGYYDAYYGQAQKVRTLIARDFAAAFEHGRRARLADHADHRVPDRRQGRRPDGDVPQRPVHHPGEPRGHPGDLGAVAACRRRRPAGRAADHGAGAGRRRCTGSRAAFEASPALPDAAPEVLS